MHSLIRFILLAFVFVLACAADGPSKREFRAVWVATFHNIDWPSKKGLPSSDQKREFLELIARQKGNGMNALVVQVRPSGDAFYRSRWCPWSEYITGKQGQEPDYDPLEFMIKATHENNMEFHAWMNPFRAISHERFSSVHPSNVALTHPDWTIKYGERLYFNPGIPAVRRYLVAVIGEVVHNYDLDGIHFDDYFYPYQESGKYFDDMETFRQYGAGFSNIHDWRRNNIDTFIQMVSDSIRKDKPHVKFGISPVGVWRNKSQDPHGSDSRSSYTSYDMLYADVRKWLENQWIDYVAPQLYWSTRHPSANYSKLLPWWAENSFGRHVYVGHAMFKVKKNESRHWSNPEQLISQLHLNKAYDGISGSIFYSANSFEGNPYQIEDRLKKDFFKYPALVPGMAWKDSIPPLPPTNLRVSLVDDQVHLNWRLPPVAADGERATYYVVYRFEKGDKINLGSAANIVSIARNLNAIDWTARPRKAYTYVVTSVDRLHNESLTCAAVVLSAPENSIISTTDSE